MAKSKSSKRWLKEHFNDPYVKQAQEFGYRSRAAFKLLEIQKKDQLLKPNMIVVDLGAAPGGWSQVSKKLIGKNGKIFALDILNMEPIANVEFIQGDFTQSNVFKTFLKHLKGEKVDLVLSDMAPNISGIKVSDQAKSMYLAEIALEFAKQTLKLGGHFLVKVFQGAGFDEYIKEMRATFTKVLIRKPKASRDRSRELYLLGKEFKLMKDDIIA